MTGGCPFGHSSSPTVAEAPTGHERIRIGYEEYIHLPWLQKAWANPVTDKPALEPCFAAAFHSIELSFLLLSEFLRDDRLYVSKRPRIERVADGLRSQCQLLCDLVDGELEEDVQESGQAGGITPPLRTTLTQPFPFEGCPPTLHGQPARSPGLGRLAVAIDACLPTMTAAERNSLVKVVLSITSAFSSSFARWTVGLGIESQLNNLLALLDLPPAVREWDDNLDYNLLVQPLLVERTLTAEVFTNAEDFFFRTIHLAAECWMFVGLNRLRCALELAGRGSWDVASARILQAAGIMNYLGEHILALMSMNTRDYLLLKVELEGTSGAGSSQVKSARAATMRLMSPLREAAAKLGALAGEQSAAKSDGGPSPFEIGLMEVYEFPDRHPGLYNYAKSLEDVECALLGGFYYRHFRLAASIIGSAAPGTIKTSVAALKPSYEVALFPVLDHIRSQLGAKLDEDLAHVKGRMVDAIVAKYCGAEAAAVAPLERLDSHGAVLSIAAHC